MYETLFAGVGASPEEAIDSIFEADGNDPVVLSRLTFYSVCEHHLLPFFGEATLAYIPDGKIAGVSKLARALDLAARRPQIQERLTTQVADAVNQVLRPDGVIVELEAEHLCMSMRGVQKPGVRMTTSAVRGEFRKHPLGREGLLALMHSGRHGS
jgi:GTP cyclohydrolase I